MKRITVDLEDALHTQLKIQCATEGITIMNLVRRLVEQYLAKGGDHGKRNQDLPSN